MNSIELFAKELQPFRGQTHFAEYSPDGKITGFQVFVVLERYEKHTKDNMHLTWFPHVLRTQRVLLQAYRADRSDSESWEPVGEPRTVNVEI